nr:MAG TPA: hypothetical protein [Crassvirales sp.]
MFVSCYFIVFYSHMFKYCKYTIFLLKFHRILIKYFIYPLLLNFINRKQF